MDKIMGMIYGALYGDALGTPYEFRKTKIDAGNIRLSKMNRFDRYRQVWKETALGQYSDDTEMALIILRHLVNNNMTYNATSVAIDYMEWANSRMPFMGKNTRALFLGVRTITGYKKRFESTFPSEDIKQLAQSNGSLMRCYPFALMGLAGKDYEKYLERDCRLTNPSDAVIIGEKQYIKAIISALNGKSKDEILQDWNPPTDIPDITNNKGWFAHALYCTFMSLRDFDDYNDAIKHIISMGGDTDTNACIAGALLGAYFGISKMNECNEFKDNLTIMLNCDSKKGDFPRPTEYAPVVILSLIDELKKIFV